MNIRKMLTETLEAATRDFLDARRAERLSEHTLADYSNTLKKFISFLDKSKLCSRISADDIRAFLAAQTTVSAKTLLNYHTGLSSFWNWLVEQGVVTANVVRQVKPPRPDKREIIPFTREQVVALLHATDRSRAYRRAGQRECDHATRCGPRDRAVIYLLLDTGMRISELCDLKVEDLEVECVRIRSGKGRKERTVPISETTHAFLWIYLDSRGKLKGEDSVFCLKPRGAELLFDRLSARSAVKDVHPHRFRHTFAINYLRNGGDPFTLQNILGHATMDMVKRYLAISRMDVQRAHARSSPVTNWGI